MLNSYDVARYFLSKDPDRILFNRNLIERNDRKFYEGNARLNKYLHIAQILYIAKTGEKLFSDHKLSEVLKAYREYHNTHSIDENKNVYMSKEEIIQLNQ